MTRVHARTLTEQQRAVVALVAAGRLSKQIAHELGIHESTVKAHISDALTRLNMSGANRVRLALWYLSQLEPDARADFIEASLGA